ncbi:MAG: phosphate ABC transporter permease subunit PstC [Armatimonadota bacterium]|nr:phosphate ABC transporter permease subunit PstC [Armatimonadota bacterium]MDR7469253.1 phosphate ABC transporter permease subunit PstC [Armatimonadota bacterium]MDR7538966.1 phosphate ABC transporter permease subunit PstC [Armatimonadota bacterium]
MASVVAAPASGPVAAHRGDRLFGVVLAAAALAVPLLLGGLLLALLAGAWPAVQRFGLTFFAGSTWDPVTHEFGALPFIYGTLVSSTLGLSMAVPLGLGVAIFLSELAPGWLRVPVGFLVELLAAVPSVVFGLWGIFILVPWVRSVLTPLVKGALGFLPLFDGPPLGIGMLAAGLILAIMVVPFIVAVGTSVMRAVPTTQREAALALGATRWETTRRAVLPYARSGIMGAVFLALARALGETMAVTMVIGNVPQIKASLLAPAYTIPAVIANEFTEATSDLYVAALIYTAVALFIVTVVVNAAARLLVGRAARDAVLGE